MASLSDNPVILVRESDGSTAPFSAARLRTRLLDAFLQSGRRDSVDIADDIALAVEFTLRQNPRTEAVFATSELDAAVLRLLEEAGFPEVAGVFGRVNAATKSEIAPERPALQELFQTHLAVPPERMAMLIDAVLELCQRLGFEKFSPHLLLELARHCEGNLEAQSAVVAADLAAEPPFELSRQELEKLLDPAERALLDSGICRINGITPLFPCVRFYILMNRLAEREQFQAPLTELEIYPLLYQLGDQLKSLKQKIDDCAQRPEPLPVMVVLPDMRDFVRQYFGDNCRTLAGELGEILAAALADQVYKLSIL